MFAVLATSASMSNASLIERRLGYSRLHDQHAHALTFAMAQRAASIGLPPLATSYFKRSDGAQRGRAVPASQPDPPSLDLPSVRLAPCRDARGCLAHCQVALSRLSLRKLELCVNARFVVCT